MRELQSGIRRIKVQEAFVAGRQLLMRPGTLTLSVLVGLFMVAVPQSGPANHRQPLSNIQLKSGSFRIHAKVAATPRQREEGLAHRRVLPFNQGMLFVWPTAATYCMWMKETSLPLTAIFLSDQGVVVSLAAMAPHSLDRHCAPEPVRYILELPGNRGEPMGITRGSVIDGLPAAK